MTDILQKISDYKRQEIEIAKSSVPLEEIITKANAANGVRGFEAALRAKRNQGKTGLIAEIKINWKNTLQQSFLHHRTD